MNKNINIAIYDEGLNIYNMIQDIINKEDNNKSFLSSIKNILNEYFKYYYDYKNNGKEKSLLYTKFKLRDRDKEHFLNVSKFEFSTIDKNRKLKIIIHILNDEKTKFDITFINNNKIFNCYYEEDYNVDVMNRNHCYEMGSQIICQLKYSIKYNRYNHNKNKEDFKYSDTECNEDDEYYYSTDEESYIKKIKDVPDDLNIDNEIKEINKNLNLIQTKILSLKTIYKEQKEYYKNKNNKIKELLNNKMNDLLNEEFK